MRRRQKTIFDESLTSNNVAYMQYLFTLTELSMSMFKWSGLPPSVDARFMELALFSNGAAVYFIDDVIGDLALQFTTGGPQNVYREPVIRRAYAVNGYRKTLTEDNSVIIWNNYLHTPSELVCRRYAKRLWDYDSTVDVNIHAQKTPVLLVAPDGQKLTIENLYKEYAGNAPVIHGEKNLDVQAIKVLSTGAPFVADKVYEVRCNIWNEALTYLGISNISIAKKERVIKDEVRRGMGGVLAMRNSRVKARKEAAEKINRMFDREISVEYDEAVNDLVGDFVDNGNWPVPSEGKQNE